MKLNFIIIVSLVFSQAFVSCSDSNGKKEKIPGSPAREDSSSVEKNSGEKFIYDCALLKREATRMDSTILVQTETNVKLANKAITAFTEFAYHCSSDSLTPIYLIKTAQVAQAINKTPQAKVVLEKCINDYPNFKNRAAAIFLLAQLYDEAAYLDNEAQAKILYQKIIDEYPKSDWAVSARGALRFIGKSDQQIMDELKKEK